VTALGKPVVDEAVGLEQDDFLAFWRTRQAEAAPETKRILGVEVVVPTDMPLRVETMAAQMQDTQDSAELKALLAELFGADHLDAWIAHGLTAQMMKVIVAWGIANATGTPCTFERAMELAEQAEADEAGKALPVANRADRRVSSGTGKSASTGRSSSPTSAASTTSRRRKSAS
jgi:hypothetical protein